MPVAPKYTVRVQVNLKPDEAGDYIKEEATRRQVSESSIARELIIDAWKRIKEEKIDERSSKDITTLA